MIDNLMRKFPDFDLIMWLDSDKYFVNYSSTNIVKLATKYADYNMWISPDAPPKHSEPFCAGSFIIRNNKEGRNIIEEWKTYYIPSDLVKVDTNKWKTDKSFAGTEYEQGSFIEKMLYRKELKICVLPYYVFNETNVDKPTDDSISIHLAGEYKDNYDEKK